MIIRTGLTKNTTQRIADYFKIRKKYAIENSFKFRVVNTTSFSLFRIMKLKGIMKLKTSSFFNHTNNVKYKFIKFI